MRPAQLTTTDKISRDSGSRAFPLNEANLPTSKNLIDIIEYLNVEKSLRYKRKELNGKIVATYCNIYAFDVVYLLGQYLPRVFWNKEAIEKLNKGQTVVEKYAQTVFEINANGLFDWFSDFGSQFGWIKQTDFKTAQEIVNAGGIGIIVAKQKNLSRSGHITVIAPDQRNNKGKEIKGRFCPLQSQAGVINQKYFVSEWYLNPRYSGYSCYTIPSI